MLMDDVMMMICDLWWVM